MAHCKTCTCVPQAKLARCERQVPESQYAAAHQCLKAALPGEKFCRVHWKSRWRKK